MTRLLRALLPALVVGLIATPAPHLMAQDKAAYSNRQNDPINRAKAKGAGYTDAEIDAFLRMWTKCPVD